MERDAKEPGVPFFPGEIYTVGRDVVIQAFKELDNIDPDPTKNQVATVGKIPFECIALAVKSFDRYFRSDRDSQNFIDQELKRNLRISLIDPAAVSTRVDYDKKVILSAFRLRLTLAERILLVLETPSLSSWAGRFLTTIVVLAICTSTMVLLVSSHPNFQVIDDECREIHRTTTEPCDWQDAKCIASCEPKGAGILPVLESICCVIFTIDIALRLFLVHATRAEIFDEDFIASRVLVQGAKDADETVQVMNEGGVFSPEALQKHEDHFLDKIEKSSITSPVRRTFKYLAQPGALADVLSVGPYWLDFCGLLEPGSALSGLFVLRVLRLLRVFRIFRLGKHGQMLGMMTRVARRSEESLLVFVAIVIFICLIFGTTVWIFEKGQWLPEGHPVLVGLGIEGRPAFVRSESLHLEDPAWAESPYRSVLHASWWTVVTITCVGYGDMYPTTDLGKVAGILTSLVGVAILAMPIGVIGSNFMIEFNEIMRERKKREKAVESQRKRKLKLMRQVSGVFEQAHDESWSKERIPVKRPEPAPKAKTTTCLAPSPAPAQAPAQSSPTEACRPTSEVTALEVPVTAEPALTVLEDWWLSEISQSGVSIAARSHWLPLRKRKKAVESLKSFRELRQDTEPGSKKGKAFESSRQPINNIAKLSGKLQLWLADELCFGSSSGSKEAQGASAAELEIQKLVTTLEGAAGLASAFRSTLIQIYSNDRRDHLSRKVDCKSETEGSYSRATSKDTGSDQNVDPRGTPTAPPPSRAGFPLGPHPMHAAYDGPLLYEQYGWDELDVPPGLPGEALYHSPYEVASEPKCWEDPEDFYGFPEHSYHPVVDGDPAVHPSYHHNDMGYLPGLWSPYGPSSAYATGDYDAPYDESGEYDPYAM
jgi:hypothetical protein